MMIPPMGQAALGIEIVTCNDKVREIAMSLNDADTYLCTLIERDFISAIGAGCSAPVACNAVVDGDAVTLRTMIGFSDGTNIMQEKIIAKKDVSRDIGKELAQKMIADGALELLKQAEQAAFKEQMPQRL